MMATSLLHRLDARDRALFVRWASTAAATRRKRRAWTTLTHTGGATCTIVASTVPLGFHGAIREAARLALITLVVSHLIVQLIKRTVGRPRPSRGTSCATLVTEPDKFSFPSGHAAAAMSVAFAYAVVFRLPRRPWSRSRRSSASRACASASITPGMCSPGRQSRSRRGSSCWPFVR